jgi:hypothetical protein
VKLTMSSVSTNTDGDLYIRCSIPPAWVDSTGSKNMSAMRAYSLNEP